MPQRTPHAADLFSAISEHIEGDGPSVYLSPDDYTFLYAQEARLINVCFEHTMTPAHRRGLFFLLEYSLRQCLLAQIAAKIPREQAATFARNYIDSLFPQDFKAFSTVVTRVANVDPGTLERYRACYQLVLPIVQATLRPWRTDADPGAPREVVAVELMNELIARLKEAYPDFQQVRHWNHWVTLDLFFRNDRLRRPSEVAQLFAARYHSLGDRSQVQLKRYLKRPAHAPWRVPAWETTESEDLLQAHFPSTASSNPSQ